MKIKNELKKIAAMLTMVSMMQGGMNNDDNIVYASESEFSLEQLLNYDYLLNENEKQKIDLFDPVIKEYIPEFDAYYEIDCITVEKFVEIIGELYEKNYITTEEVETFLISVLENSEEIRKNNVSLNRYYFYLFIIYILSWGLCAYTLKKDRKQKN